MAETEYGLRAVGTGRILMKRTTWNEKDEACWTDLATFGSYNDAEWTLRLIRRGTGVIEPSAAVKDRADAWFKIATETEEELGRLVRIVERLLAKRHGATAEAEQLIDRHPTMKAGPASD